MPTDIRHSALSQAVGDVLQDVSGLVHKEILFARAELASSLHTLVWKVAWIGLAAVCALVALLALTEAVIFALVDQGMAAHIACLAVGGALILVALIAFAAARSRASSPSRSLQHLSAGIRTAKEHLT